MDGSHNGGNPPAITKNKSAHRNVTARILFSIFTDIHDEVSIIMTRIAIRDYNRKELLTTIQDEDKIKVLVEPIETKVTIVRRNSHWAVVGSDFCRYHHDGCHGFKPLVFSDTDLT